MKKILTLILLSFLGINLSAQDTIALNPSNPGIAVPLDFTGLSYEMVSMQSGYFRPGDAALIQYFNTLGVKVLRIGGNSVETYNFYNGNASTTYPNDTITPAEIDSLFGFAAAVNCQVMFGLNFGGNFDPSLAAQEAEYITQNYGSQLLAFEIGNEPNLYVANGLRPSGYNYSAYRAEFIQYVDSIWFYSPNASISGATAARNHGLNYTLPFCQDMVDTIMLLTMHNYDISDTVASISQQIINLLSPQTLDTVLAIADTLVYCATNTDHRSFRMSECNSEYPYGQWNVANSFAASLWGLDYMYALAEANVSGVNFHTFNGSPSCAIHDTLGVFSARPLYYGILAFQYGREGRFLPVHASIPTLNINTYSVLDSLQNIIVTIINKDTAHGYSIRLNPGNPDYSSAEMWTLSASTPSDTFGVTLAGTSVNTDGTWLPGPPLPVNYSNGYYSFDLPGATAYILKLTPTFTGIHSPSSNQNISLFPNPSNSTITLHTTISIVNYQLSIANVLGEEVYHQNLLSQDSQIDVSKLSQGVYFYELIAPDNTGTIIRGKFLKE